MSFYFRLKKTSRLKYLTLIMVLITVRTGVRFYSRGDPTLIPTKERPEGHVSGNVSHLFYFVDPYEGPILSPFVESSALDRTIGVDPEPRDDNLYPLKRPVVVTCTSETLTLRNSGLGLGSISTNLSQLYFE